MQYVLFILFLFKRNETNVSVTGLRGIKYGENRTNENIYGIGSYPIGRGKGKIEPTASVTVQIDKVWQFPTARTEAT